MMFLFCSQVEKKQCRPKVPEYKQYGVDLMFLSFFLSGKNINIISNNYQLIFCPDDTKTCQLFRIVGVPYVQQQFVVLAAYIFISCGLHA